MRTTIVTIALGLLAGLPVAADDWPQWMGPQRDNVWREKGVLSSFPDAGPRKLWSTRIAGGYAGPAVAGGRVVVTDYVTKDNVKVDNFDRNAFTGLERVSCLDQRRGTMLWQYEYPVEYSISYPAGPRCTPLIEEGRVHTLGAEGHLYCFALDSGKVLWSKDLKKQYNTKSALWGYAGHPLIDGDRLICAVGGEGSHTVAFDKRTGDELWRAETAPEQGYSPPLIIEAGGVRQLIMMRPDAVVSLNPVNGRRYWSVPYQASNGSIIMTPVRWGDHLYVGGFSNKNLLVQLGREKPTAEIVWRDQAKAAIAPVNVQPLLVGDVIYGFDQRGSLMAVELPSGKRLWETAEPLGQRPAASATAMIVRQGDRFWMFSEQGDLIIARMNPQGFSELDRAHLLKPTNVAFGRDVVWSAPAFADRKIYVRNDEEIACFDLSDGQTQP